VRQKTWNQNPIPAYNHKERESDGPWHQMPCDSVGALHKEELCEVYPQVTYKVAKKGLKWEKAPNPLPTEPLQPLEISPCTGSHQTCLQEEGRKSEKSATPGLRQATKRDLNMTGTQGGGGGSNGSG
jgi:hypothetical protein